MPLTDAWLDALRQFPNLTALHVTNGNSSPVATTKRLAELKALSSLCILSLQGRDRWKAVTALPLRKLLPSVAPDLEPADCERVASMPDLETFSLYDMKLTAEMLTALAPSPKLNALSITNCVLPATGIEHIARLPKSFTLTIKVKEFDDVRLAHLGGSKSLNYLFVKDSAVTESGVQALA